MNFSSNWSNVIWKIVKPTELVDCIVAVIRIATKPLLAAFQLTTTDKTIATGEQFITVSVRPENITTAFTHTDKGEGIISYKLTGLPQGAVSIGKSPDGVTALRFVDFEEVSDGYLFSKNPGNFGVVSDRNGIHCTFCICLGAPVNVRFQDIAGSYKGALSDEVVDVVYSSTHTRTATNGVSGRILALACGCTTSAVSGALDKQWVEGDTRCASVADCLVCSHGKPEAAIKTYLQDGDTLTDIRADYVVVPLTAEDRVVYMDPSLFVNNLPSLYSEYPKLAGAQTFDDVKNILKLYDQVTYDTTHSANDSGSQKLIKSLLTLPDGVHLVQKLNIHIPATVMEAADSVAVICSDTQKQLRDPVEDQSGLSYLLQEAHQNSVIIIQNLQRAEDRIYAMTDKCRCLSTYPKAGQYIQKILFLQKNGDSSVILSEIKVANTVIRAGESIIISAEIGE